jgi:signal transduction histidine kinase
VATEPVERTSSGLPAAPEPASPPLAAVTDEVDLLVERLLREEKLRWAYEIHDGLTQSVTAAILELERLRTAIREDPREAERDVSEVALEMRRALADVRRVLFELSDVMADRTQLPDLDEFVAEVRRRWGLDVLLKVEGEMSAATPSAVQVAGLVAREALINAAKHSHTDRAEVHVRVERHHLAVEVMDFGCGFPPSDRGHPRHFGMRMMERRVREVGGAFDIRSEPGSGTIVSARLPLRPGS